MIRLRPGSNVRRTVGRGPVPIKKRSSKTTLGRWLFLYIPIVSIACVIVYILVELFIKHIAVKTVQSQLPQLPETLETLPVAPTVSTPPADKSKVIEGRNLTYELPQFHLPIAASEFSLLDPT